MANKPLGEDNTAEAIKWFRLAAEQNQAEAQSLLGVLYLQGRGALKNESEGMKWLRKAAQQGDALALFTLASCYEGGLGVEADKAEACKWLMLAAVSKRQGYESAAKLFQGRLSPEQIAEGQRRAQNWLDRRKNAAMGKTDSKP